MANSADRKRKAMMHAKVVKKAAMFANGERSRYFKRVEARRRGEPMATRPVMPWWFKEFSQAFSENKATA